MYCLTPNLSHVFQELLSVDLFVLGNIEFVLTMLGLCCSLEVARTSGLQSPISLETGELLPQPSVIERVAIAKEHLAKSLEVKGDRVGILEMRRHLTNYFKGLPDFKQTRLKLVTSFDVEELRSTLDYVAERWGDFDMRNTVPAPLSHDI